MARTIAFSNKLVVSCTLPSGSITALMPDTDACSTGRAVSAARIWLFARCCAELPERWYERLLVLTTTSLGAFADGVADERPERRLEADHAADLVSGRREHDGLVARLEVVRDLAQLADEAELVAPRNVFAERDEVLLRVDALARAVGAVHQVRVVVLAVPGGRARVHQDAGAVLLGDVGEPGSEVGIEIGVGVERAFGEHDEVVVAVQLVGQREMGGR